MTLSKLKTGLLLGSAFLLTACNGEVSTETAETSKVQAETAATEEAATKDSDYNMVTYDTPGQTDEDHLYLEEVLGEKALDQVKTWNKRTLDELMADPRFEEMQSEALEILNSKDKIPYVSYRGGEVHNFWQDADHVRGIWRKSTLESYLGENTSWETVLDFDKPPQMKIKTGSIRAIAALPQIMRIASSTCQMAAKTPSSGVSLTPIPKPLSKTAL